MKTLIYHTGILILLVIITMRLHAQDSSLSNEHLNFSLNEKQHSTGVHRIPQAITTNNYDLKYHRFYWFIDPAKFYISGSVTSYFVATQAGMKSIQFLLNSNLTSDSALVKGKSVSVDHTGDLITIPLNQEVPTGTLDSVTVFYHGIPDSNGLGSFCNYVHNGAPSMWTASEPYGASDWWPSKNDLTDKIDSIDVYVVMPKGNHAASNGILVSETPYGLNSILAHWKHRYPIASYLIAIAVTNYARYSEYYKTATDSIEILNYVYPEDSVAFRSISTDAIKSMELLEHLFSPYPFRKEKFGHAEVNIGDGMEQQTMTFLGKNAFNHFTITHELSHQWFGDMITCGSWEDIWLNEGFSTYCLLLSYEYLYHDNSFNAYKDVIWDKVLSKPQGSVFCNDTTSATRIFNNSLSYNKGASLLVMLRWMLGDSDFFQGIKNYLNDPGLKYGFARTSNLKKHLETQSGKDLTAFFAEWFKGTGVPGYSIQVDQQPDLSTRITINQTQYNSDVSFFNMVLPVEFKGENNDTTLILNNTFSGQTFTFNPDFRIESVIFDPKLNILYNQSDVRLNQITQNQHVIENQISIKPNPVTKFMKVQHKPGEIRVLQILNPEGKSENLVSTKQDDTLLELNTEHLQPGMYILKIGTSDWIETKKFIVTK